MSGTSDLAVHNSASRPPWQGRMLAWTNNFLAGSSTQRSWSQSQRAGQHPHRFLFLHLHQRVCNPMSVHAPIPPHNWSTPSAPRTRSNNRLSCHAQIEPAQMFEWMDKGRLPCTRSRSLRPLDTGIRRTLPVMSKTTSSKAAARVSKCSNPLTDGSLWGKNGGIW